jgi:Flp pilus assembly protein TadD
MRMLPITLLAASLGALAAPVSDDRTSPARLNAAALEHMGRGDFGTASILLARAALLAPRDPEVARSLRLLEERKAGGTGPADAPASSPASTAQPPIPPEPPAPWPRKPATPK